MTDAELDAIEARAKEAETALVNGPEATALFDSVADVPELVAEVRRLQAEVALCCAAKEAARSSAPGTPDTDTPQGRLRIALGIDPAP